MTAQAPTPACLLQPDFPDWLHPLLVKSLRQSLRSKVFVGVFLWTQVSLAALVGMQVVATGEQASLTLHVCQWVDIFLILAVMVPLWPVFVNDEDRRPESLDLIRLTRVSTQKLADGKMICAITQAVLLSLAMLPYGLLCHYLGGIEVTNELMAFLWVLANMIVLAPWGVLIGGLPVGGRIALAPLLLGALLFVFGGLMAILLASVSGLWCPWFAVAPIAWLIGFALSAARYDVR